MKLHNLEKVRLPNFSVSILVEVLDEAGLDSDVLLKQCGIPRESLGDPSAMISCQQELTAQMLFARISAARRDLWVKAGLRYRVIVYNTMGFTLATSHTLRDLLDLYEQYCDFSYTLSRFVFFDAGPETMGLTFDFSDVPRDLLDFQRCRDTVGLTVFFHEIWSGRFPFERIELANPSPVGTAFDFNAPVHGGYERTSWYWQKALMDTELPSTSTSLHTAYRRQLESLLSSMSQIDAFLERVVTYIDGAGEGSKTLSHVASLMHMSTRTLQRHLTERNVSFRALVNESRMRTAKRMLSDSSQSIAKIAWELGYSDPSCFYQAFRRSTNQSPTRYRKDISSEQREVA